MSSEDDEMAAWEDNWDDDTVEEDFAVQLVRFARKRAHSPPLRSPEEQPAAKKRCSRASPMQVDEEVTTQQQVRFIHLIIWHEGEVLKFQVQSVPSVYFWVRLTSIWVFHHLAVVPCPFCQIHITPGRIRQRAEHS